MMFGEGGVGRLEREGQDVWRGRGRMFGEGGVGCLEREG